MMDHTQAITTFLVEEFLPDVPADSLTADYDLLSGGVLDSLGLLKVIVWLEDRFNVVIDDIEIEPDNFRTVAAINAFVRSAQRTA
ncbi:MAG: acyl carrier protein [Pseudonocardiales bacterium]|nr:acyl carrier protein [Pseudonocardiales bacterium]